MIIRELLSVLRKMQRLFNEHIQDTNLGSGQIFILLAVIDSPGINQDELCRILDIDKSTATKGMKILLDKKHIIRVQDKHDKRNRLLFPSKVGEKTALEAVKKIKEFEIKICNEAGKENIILLNNILSSLKNLN